MKLSYSNYFIYSFIDVKIPRYSTMLVNIGITLFIGTALPQKKTNLLDNLETLLLVDGVLSTNFLKNSRVKLLLISVQDGLGLQNKVTI